MITTFKQREPMHNIVETKDVPETLFSYCCFESVRQS
jgi:hypothetical protein